MSQNSPTVKQALLSFLNDEAFWNEVDNLKGQSQALRHLFESKGYAFTPEEWRAGLEEIAPSELSDHQLKGVSAGGSTAHASLHDSLRNLITTIFGETSSSKY